MTKFSKRNKKRAKFGAKWYGRFGHFSGTYPDGVLKTFGADEFGLVVEWPKLCDECAYLFATTDDAEDYAYLNNEHAN